MKTFSSIEPLSNFQIIDKCKELAIKHFKGVFMRDELNKNNKATDNECLLLNLDSSSNDGTHWTCLFIKDNVCCYFDSNGFPPPEEVKKYCSNKSQRYHSTDRIQKPNQVICGHFCIYVLYKLSNGYNFLSTLDELYRYNNKFNI